MRCRESYEEEEEEEVRKRKSRVSLLGWINGTYIPDRSDAACVMFYPTGLRCLFVRVSGVLLMMSGWLINA